MAQVKQYDPNEYNFGNFAETMNNNAAIDMAQNAQGGTANNGAVSLDASGNKVANTVSPGEVPNSQTLGNSSGELTFGSVTEGFRTALNGASQGQAVEYSGSVSSILPSSDSPTDTPDGSGVNNVSVTPDEAVTSEGAVTAPELMSPESSGDVTSDPLGWIQGEESSWITGSVEEDTDTDTEGVTVEGGTPRTETGSDLSWLPSTEGTSDEKSGNTILGFEEWQSAYAVDPSIEYKNAQAQLDYEFQTWMSTYGARAEELYQMGLSNSGVSDIYGATAYTAYIQASMDLKRAEIQMKKQNAQEYQKYVDGIKATQKAEQDAADMKISTGASAYLSTYTPEKSKQIYNALIAQGYSESEAAEIIRKLDSYYYATPEEDRPDIIESNQKVADGYDLYVDTYNPNNSQNIYNELVTVHGLTKQEAMTVIKKLQTSYEANAPAKDDEAAKNAFDYMMKQLEAGELDLEQLKAKAKAYGFTDEAIAKAAENMAPFIEEATEDKFETDIGGAYGYVVDLYSNGTAKTEADLRALLTNANYSEEVINEAITRFNNIKHIIDAGTAEEKTTAALGMMYEMLADGTTNINTLKSAVSAFFGQEAADAAALKLNELINLSADDQKKAITQECLAWMIDAYNSGVTDRVTLEKQAFALFGDKSVAKKAYELMEPFREYNETQITASKDTIINDAATLFAYQDGEYAYDGSESYKTYVRQMLNTSAYSMYKPYADEIIAKMDENLKANQGAVVEDTIDAIDAIVNTSPESLVMSTLDNDLKTYKTQLASGKITQEQYDQYAQSYSNAAIKAYEWATKSVDNLANAYAMFGYDESEWAGMDDEEREAAIMDAMAEYRNEGLVSEASYNSLVSDWAVSELTTYKETSPSDVFESAGAIVSDLSTFPVSSSARDEIINTIIGEIGLNLQDLMLSWSINGKTKQAGVDLIRGSLGKGTTDVRGELLKAGYYSPYGAERYSVYNGKIYVSFDDAGETWYEISEKNLNFTGDARGIAKAEMAGIYAIIARLIEDKLQQPEDTRR